MLTLRPSGFISTLGTFHLNNFLLFKQCNSPYINHFVSADTIVPGYTNPQHLNRYSYVTNNPLRYIDPSGHRFLENEFGGGCSTSEYCGSSSNNNSGSTSGNGGGGSGGGGGGNYCDTHPNACGGGSGQSATADSSGDNGEPPPPDGYYCQGSGWHCWANFTQDAATTFNFFSVGLEVYIVIDGCIYGPEGCAGGLLASWYVFNSGPNQIESLLSGTSLLLTAVDDYNTNGGLGENTATSFTTFLVGGMSPDPIVDFVVDGYASGYNHGFFNGIGTIFNGGPVFQNPAIYK